MHDPMDHAANPERSAFAPPWIRACNYAQAPRAVGAIDRTLVDGDPLADKHADPGSAGGDDPSAIAGKLSIDGFTVPRSHDARGPGL